MWYSLHKSVIIDGYEQPNGKIEEYRVSDTTKYLLPSISQCRGLRLAAICTVRAIASERVR